MREISHRSKNLLAVIQSISRQTRRSSKDLAEFGRLFDDRLQSLARSHDLLVERNWGGTLVRDLVKAQLHSFVDGRDTRVEIEGPAILLSPAASQHIGLAIHELATNASKYGALSVADGKVRVAWSTAVDDEGTDRFRMSWTERGGPPVQQPTRKGFGRFVVEEAVGRGVMGTASIDWSSEGLAWTLDAPTSCLSASSELFGLTDE
jgi:two-component sensor histidine kinase